MDIIKYNSKAWDKEVEKGNIWSLPVSEEIIEKAKQDDWSIVLTPKKPVPRNWFPQNMNRLKILCLAGGGGQQGPVLAAAGAEVTVFDNSENQLKQDEFAAKMYDLNIKTVKGNMKDLGVFDDQTFDLIVHPVSNVFVDNILPVWKEAYRVLKPNGVMISGFNNPLIYIFDFDAHSKGKLEVKYSIPYSDLESLSEEKRQHFIDNNEPLEFGHSLEDQIKGQLDAGFVISGFYEDNYQGKYLLDQYINTYIATRAVKLISEQYK